MIMTLGKLIFLIEMHLGESEINNSKGYSDKIKQESGAISAALRADAPELRAFLWVI